MLIGLAVRLIIPDTTAVSARRALRQAGLTEMQDLRREVCWTFDVADDQAPQAVAERLMATDVLVNYNKHRARWWSGTMDAASPPEQPPGLQWGLLLVEDRDDPAPMQMQRVLTTRLGFTGLRVSRRATLWSIGVTIGAPASQVTERAARLLLVNPHGQIGDVLLAGPGPLGGSARPAVP
jgi:hypothetical protein